MFCPLCRHDRVTTTSRPGDLDVEHRCDNCGHTWWTRRPPRAQEPLAKAEAPANPTDRHDTPA